MESNANTEVDKLISFGKMALEQGWYEQARDHFEQALAVDADNREAMKHLARVNEILSQKRTTDPVEIERPTDPSWTEKISHQADSALSWIQKKREDRANRIAEQERLIAEKRAEERRLAAEKREERAREIARRKKEEGVLMTAQGVECVLELLEDKIRIRREEGFEAKLLGRRTKEIPLKHITAIQFKKAGRITGGHIKFSLPGGWGAAFEGGMDSFVLFNREQQPDFERIKAEIEKRIQAESIASAPSSGADEIAKLADLRDKGILTEEEFQQKKKQVLGL